MATALAASRELGKAYAAEMVFDVEYAEVQAGNATCDLVENRGSLRDGGDDVEYEGFALVKQEQVQQGHGWWVPDQDQVEMLAERYRGRLGRSRRGADS